MLIMLIDSFPISWTLSQYSFLFAQRHTGGLCLVAQRRGCTVNGVPYQSTSPSDCTPQPSSSGSHRRVSVSSSSHLLECCRHRAPLSHVMGKVHSSHHSFFLNVRNKLCSQTPMMSVLFPNFYGRHGNRPALHGQ